MVWSGSPRCSNIFLPSLGSRVELSFLASKQAAASTHEMGKHQISIMVGRIWPNFWWMVPVGMKYNHTKSEQQTQKWRPGSMFLLFWFSRMSMEGAIALHCNQPR